MSGGARKRQPRQPRQPRPPRQPRAAHGPKGFPQDAVLSEEEVQRRVELHGGGAPPLAPPELRVRDRLPPPPPRIESPAAARVSLLLVGLVIAGVVAVTVLVPEGPLTARSTNAPSFLGSAAAVAPSAAATTAVTPAPVSTPDQVTLPPPTDPVLPTPAATPVPATAVPATPAPATQAPATTGPRATPRVTPRPTATPKVTPKPTPPPTTTPPQTATLLVKVTVSNGDGGTATPANWTVSVSSSGPASPSSFAGSAGGTSVTLRSGATYTVTATGPSGYQKSASANCASSTGGTVVGGSSETCTFVLNDRKPTITVFTFVDNTGGGTLTAADFTVVVTGTAVSPSAIFPGSEAGVDVHVRAGTAYTIEQTGGFFEYTQSAPSAKCTDPSGLPVGVTVTCTVTFTYVPQPAPATGFTMLLPALLAAHLGGRRRWSRNPTR